MSHTGSVVCTYHCSSTLNNIVFYVHFLQCFAWGRKSDLGEAETTDSDAGRRSLYTFTDSRPTGCLFTSKWDLELELDEGAVQKTVARTWSRI